MTTRVEFDVYGRTESEMREEAANKLMGLLGKDWPSDGVPYTLELRPAATAASGGVVFWEGTVTAEWEW